MKNRILQFKPTSVLTVYQSGNQYYVEQSMLNEEGYQTGSRPLTEGFIRKVFSNMNVDSKKINFGGYIPVNVIGYAEKLAYNTVVWRSPPGQEFLSFTVKQIEDGKRAIPGLVWVFGNSLDLYSYIDWKGEETVLYYAPFWNVNHENVCMGTANNYLGDDTKMVTFKNLIERVQHAFFNSKFTHAGSEQNVNKTFQGLFEKTLNAKEFPTEYLVSTKLTVKNICNEIFSS